MSKRPRRKYASDPDDLLDWFERTIAFAVRAGFEDVEIPTHVAAALLKRLRQAKRPRRGRKAVSGRAKVGRQMDVFRARQLKGALRAETKAKGQRLSAQSAGEKAAKTISHQTRDLSAAALEDRITRTGRKSRK